MALLSQCAKTGYFLISDNGHSWGVYLTMLTWQSDSTEMKIMAYILVIMANVDLQLWKFNCTIYTSVSGSA